MKKKEFLVAILCFGCVRSLDSESTETNGIEVTPFYDTIIFSDIADIFNEFENNANDELLSDSDSEENVEDLLSEYHNYLEKAQKQRRRFDAKSKNKVPLIRHERYNKKNTAGTKHEYYGNNYYTPNAYKFFQPYNNPLDFLIPLNSKTKLSNIDHFTFPKDFRVGKIEPVVGDDKKLLDLPTLLPKISQETIKSSCFCKNNKFPCDCNCKQCLLPLGSFGRNRIEDKKMPLDKAQYPLVVRTPYLNPDTTEEINDNTINIRIKVDVKLPKILESFGKLYKNPMEHEEMISKESSLPIQYFNVPIPMNLFGYKNVKESTPFHNMTIHKKKKSRQNNKRHRKKLITFHNIKLEPGRLFKHFEVHNASDYSHNENETLNSNITQVFHSNVNKTDENSAKDIPKEESIYVTVNISQDIDNGTEEHKIGNSIETEYSTAIYNVTQKAISAREKRETPGNDSILIKNVSTKIDEKGIKKTDKSLTDTELLYWPSSKTQSEASKNITAIILEREFKKAKLNITKDMLRQNHTRALEQAIFGDVDWDDVDTVAPAFMSFVGKYLSGILTFCSQSVCHSMKCGNKTCLHRVCDPQARLNNRGHCTGSNTADSVASMESIMDLPSNIAFEIVDILQDKMQGKLFGKMTLCINTKCISFNAAKKVFTKYKCSLKELDHMAHCPQVNNV